MGKKLLQNRILEHIGYVGFPEELLDQVLIDLRNNPRTVKAGNKLAQSYDNEQIYDPEFVIIAREKKYLSVCILVQKLLRQYTIDAIECMVFYHYLRALSIDLEKNLSWYEANTRNVFPVKPSSLLKEAEAALWKYLHNLAPCDQNKNRYRHLLTITFLFFDYLSYPEDLALLLDQLEREEITFKSEHYERNATKKVVESAG